MSHIPQRLCPDGHAWTSWTTAERTNDAGERCFVFQRECKACGLVDSESGGIQEENPPTAFKEVLREDTYNADD